MGQTALKKCKKQLYLVLLDNSASDNLKNLGKNLANKYNCNAIISSIDLKDIIRNEDIKILGLTDENLSKAIINYFNKE